MLRTSALRWLPSWLRSGATPRPAARPLRFEPLEDRWVPATINWNTSTSPTGGDFSVGANWVGGVVPGAADDAVIGLTSAGTVAYNAAGTLTVGSVTTNGNTTFNVNKGTVTIAASPSLGTFGAAVNVAAGATLAAGSGAKVQFAPNSLVSVSGTLTADTAAAFVGQRQFNNPGSTIAVASGGLLSLKDTALTSTGANATTQITVAGGGRLKTDGATVGWDLVALDVNANEAAGDFVNTAFDAAVSTPVKYQPLFVGNKRFKDVNLIGTTVQPDLKLDPLGVDATQQRYVFPGATFTVAANTAVTFTAGTSVLFAPNAAVNVSGTLATDGAVSFVGQRQFNNPGSTITVGSGGVLSLKDTPLTTTGANATTQINIAAGGRLKTNGATVGWDVVSLDANASEAAGDFVATAFDAALTTPVKYQPLFVGNKRFKDVNLIGTTTLANQLLDPLGVDATQQRYVFPGATFTVAANTAVTFTAGTSVLFAPNAAVNVSGTLAVDSATSFVGQRQFNNPGSTITVNSGGTLSLTNANLTSTGANATTQINVASGGNLKTNGATIAWDVVKLNATSFLAPGDIVNSAFDTTLTTPAKYVPVFVGNKRFQDVYLIAGTNDPVLNLDPLGVNTSQQRYVFAPGTFTVAAGTALNITSGTNVLFDPSAVVSIDGVLSVDTPASFVGQRQFNNPGSTITVNSGGTLSLTNANLTSTGANATTQINVASGGRLKTNGATVAWDFVTLDANANEAAGDFVDTAFDTTLTTPVKYQPVFVGNKRFKDIDLIGTTVQTSLNLGAVGVDASQERYVLPSGSLTVAAGTALNFQSGVSVFLATGGGVSVSGTLSVTSPASFIAQRGFGGNNTITVANGGTFTANNVTFAAASAASTAQIVANAGGQFNGVGNTFGWDNVTLNSGSTARLQYNFLNTTLNINSGANVSPNAVKNNDFTAVKVVASGGSTATIDLTNNYWGSTVASVINALITDHLDNAALPTVNYTPVLSARPVQIITTVTPASIPYSSSDQTVTFSTVFRSPSGSGLVNVNGGTVTYTVKDGLNNTIGTTTGPVSVSAGTATAMYTIPGGTNAGTYTIVAAFSGSGSFAAATDTSAPLFVTPVPTATAGHDATRPFTVAAGSVALTADVTLSPSGLAAGGAVVFRIFDASNNLVGTAQSFTVVNGVAAGNYPLPPNLPSGPYTIDAAYGGTTNQGASVDPVRNAFVVTTAPTTVTAADAMATFSGLNQTVNLTAGVTSVAGTVNDGAVTFTVKDGFGTTIGTAAANVVNGSATAAFTVPANTPAGGYSIDAAYGSPKNYQPGADATHTLTVNKAAQAVTFPTVPPATYSPTAGIALGGTGGGSGNPVTYSIIVVPGVTTGDGTIAGNVLTVTTAGVIVVQADQAGSGNYAAAPPVQQAISVAQATQTISFTTVPPTTYSTGLAVPLAATGGGSGNAVTFAITGGTGVGTITAGTLSVTQAGTFVVQASQAGNANYLAAAVITQTITVAPAAQTITFPAISAATYAPGLTIPLVATGGASGNAVTFTIVAGGTGVGTIAAGVLHVTQAGTFVVSADQAANANYAAAATVSQTVTVNAAGQTISFPIVPPPTYAPGLTIPLGATADSGLPAAYAITGGTGVGTITAGTLSVTQAGTFVVQASQAGNANYLAAAVITQTITVVAAGQTITFSALPSTLQFTTAAQPLTATSTSGLAVTFSVVSGPATVSGANLTYTGVGTVVVSAQQAGNANYSAAADVNQTIVVTQADQVIAFPTVPSATYAPGLTIPLGATADSGLTVGYSITGGTGLGTITSGVLSVTQAGTFVVSADQAGTANYLAAATVTQTVTVNAAAQTITFPTVPPPTYTPGLTVNLSATGGASGNPVTYSITGSTGVGSITANVLHVTQAGTFAVAANQTGDANYLAAATVTQTVTVNPACQAIAFAPVPPTTFAPGLTLNLSATGGASGNPVVFAVASGPATVSGTVLTVTGVGDVVVQATQAGSANYAAASASLTVAIDKAPQAIAFPALAPVTFAPGQTVSLAATGGASGNPVVFTVASGPAIVSGTVLTITGAGSVSVSAAQAGNADYTAASASQTLVVTPAAQAITFTPVGSATFGSGPIALAATSSSGLPVSFAVVSGPATVAGNQLTVTGAGSVVVAAAQAGNANYTAAATVTATVVVNPAPQAIVFPPSPPTVPFRAGATVTLAATGGPSGNPITYSVVSGPATISGNVLTITGPGTVVIQADQAGTTDYAPVSVRRAIAVQLPTANLLGTQRFAVGAGDASVVKVYNADGTPRFATEVFPGFTGGVRTATGDFNGDGVADVVVGTGPGGSSHVLILDGATQAPLFAVDPFEATFTGGVYVAAGDVTGDGVADLVVTPDEGGGPRVDIYNGKGFGKLTSFFGIDDPNFRGGARAAMADLTGDGTADLIVVAGFGGGPRVAAFDGPSLTTAPKKLFGDFFAFEQTLRNGIFVTAGDVNGDGFADLICGGGPGGGPRVLIFDGKALLSNQYVPLGNFFGGDPTSRGGIRPAAKDLDGDAKADLVVGAGAGAGSRVTAYLGKNIGPAGTPAEAFAFDALAGSAAGVYVG